MTKYLYTLSTIIFCMIVINEEPEMNKKTRSTKTIFHVCVRDENNEPQGIDYHGSTLKKVIEELKTGETGFRKVSKVTSIHVLREGEKIAKDLKIHFTVGDKKK